MKYAVRSMSWLASASFGLALLATAAFADPVTVRDGLGRQVTITDTSRIVSVGGAVTEILYALGEDKKVVAVDSTSQYPAQALAEKKNVGYMRQLSPEGVLGLAPSLILAIQGSGPRETLSILEAARVPMVVVPDPFSGEGILHKINLIARVTGAEAPGRCVSEAVRSDLEALAALRKQIGKPRRVMFVLSFLNGRAMVAGRNTAADGIIRLAGGVNAIDEYEGYKPINDEAVVAARPEFVLTMRRSSTDSLTAGEVFGHPGFASSPAAADRSFAAMDGLYLLGFGPRTASAARDLALTLYPSLKAPAMSPDPAGACRS